MGSPETAVPPERRFPWGALLGFAVAVLGLSPRQAWAATPRELALAAGWLASSHALAHGLAPAPTRDDLAALMARFPD
ncbi:phage tail assembly chaperone [Microbaculum marinisediminis]|uniref:Phage tail assembly chaperone n=1 Tax=Microbaculum marinisediminis TaxID=2931392 RepID=A0AAW5QSX9_9HYPH|nr:phage tail assembly chaperone [Microbaculum sp. A6E488]MCT8971211.1 phage tail assembly chaperone [Microbaculum sp. A6E488]